MHDNQPRVPKAALSGTRAPSLARALPFALLLLPVLLLLPFVVGDVRADEQPGRTGTNSSGATPSSRVQAPPPREVRGSTGGWANIFRTVTSALGGRASHRPTSGGATATIGVRGLGAGAIAAATPNEAAVRAMELLAVRGSEAADFAGAAGLVPQPLPLAAPP